MRTAFFNPLARATESVKVLFLHGWRSVPGGVKPSYLAAGGLEVINPKLDDDDFDAALKQAEAVFRAEKPQVIVGSSRGGAVAMNLAAGQTPRVLLCPAWKKWGTLRRLTFPAVILHSRQDDVIAFEDSQQLVSRKGGWPARLLEVGVDHRLADPEPLAAMLEACLSFLPRVAGSDFGVPATAGEQARKIIWLEAIRRGPGDYVILPQGRNRRLVESLVGKRWPHNRRGWTLPELCGSLLEDHRLESVAFDFPFSVPESLLASTEFAARLSQAPFGSRQRWAEFVSSQLQLAFEAPGAGGRLIGLKQFAPWRDSRFWQPRLTDRAAQASPPLKHCYPSLFAMTLAGVAMLEQLARVGYRRIDSLAHLPCPTATPWPGPLLLETYPRRIARQIGFHGSYKQEPEACLAVAERYLERRGVRLAFDPAVRRFCQQYRTGGNDPDGADAFLCLVTAICLREGLAERCPPQVDRRIRLEEGTIIVPSAQPHSASETAGEGT